MTMQAADAVEIVRYVLNEKYPERVYTDFAPPSKLDGAIVVSSSGGPPDLSSLPYRSAYVEVQCYHEQPHMARKLARDVRHALERVYYKVAPGSGAHISSICLSPPLRGYDERLKAAYQSMTFETKVGDIM